MSNKDRIEQVWRERQQRQQHYREQALRLLPWVCARCGRDFDSKRLRELTVHHKDHDHDHNPSDGSNWELLCLYCHDEEHQRTLSANHLHSESNHPGGNHRPFTGLQELLNNGKKSDPR